MSLKYFQFYLFESEFFDAEELRRYQSILGSCKEFGFIRASFDVINTDKNFSILCESEEDAVIEKNKWLDFLQKNNIQVKEKIEHEVLEEEERLKISCAHDHHSQDCHHDYDEHEHEHEDREHHDHHWLKAGIGLIFGIGLLVLSLVTFNIPMIAYYLITGFSALVTLYLGYKVYQSAWHSLMQKKWDMSLLYTISTLAIIGISIVSLFVPGLPMMFESAPLILGFWHLGEAIEHTLVEKINKKLDIRDCTSETVLLKTDSERDILVKQLIPNDIIVVKHGEVIPVDGVLTQPALLYTTRVDGSPHLKQFNPGDAVKAGMCLATHIPQVEMRVTKTYQNSYLSLIAKNISKENAAKAPIELFANKILKYFIPGLLAVALVSGVVIGLLFPPALAIQCVISVLVSACPCVLSLITPMAMNIGMKKASEKGIHYKDGKSLQAAADIDTVVFDLNGTLTQGIVSVNNIMIEDKNKVFLKFIRLLEANSSHPVAKTIKEYLEAKEGAADDSLEVSSLDTSHHSGIKGTISGETFMIGNKDMLRANGVNKFLPPYDDIRNGSIYMVRGSEIIGQIALTDTLRPDAIATVKQLQEMGKHIHICTGADKETTEKYALILGIPSDNICANTVGTTDTDNEVSKERYIRQLQKNGHKVAMIGDAANDLTAIACADVGIAVKSSIGDSVTEQHAGMVIQQGLLFPIATAFDVASKTKQNIFQNLFVSLTYNSVITLVASGLFVALGFTLNPVIGIALLVVESAIVLANLYRLKQQEVISSTSKEENSCEHKPLEETTTKVLKGLGCRPKSSLEQVEEHVPESTSSRNSLQFFGNRNNKTSNSSDGMFVDQSLVL